MIPSLFLSHGSPMMALQQDPTSLFLQQLGKNVPRPRAIVVASAHWETQEPCMTASAHPETIHDFYGFPKQLHELIYPAPGEPELAARIRALLAQSGIPATSDATRGLDHGAWSPLILMYPAADIPVVEISVQPHRDARWHYAIGQALSVLRAENILVVGTGNLTHNLREAMRGNHETAPLWVSEFADWVAAMVAEGNIEKLLAWEIQAPHARQNHPTPEHFLPFFVALGVASPLEKAERLHMETALGVLAMDAYAFN